MYSNCNIKLSCSVKGIEPKKTDEDGKYVPINLRMQRTQVCNLYLVLSFDPAASFNAFFLLLFLDVVCFSACCPVQRLS